MIRIYKINGVLITNKIGILRQEKDQTQMALTVRILLEACKRILLRSIIGSYIKN